MTETITSLQNETVKKVHGLHLKKNRTETGLFYAQGLRTVCEGMDSKDYKTEMILVLDQALRDDSEIKTIHARAQKSQTQILVTNDRVMEKLAGRENFQPVIGVFRTKTHRLDDWDKTQSDFTLVLDRIRDPGNLGTILRTLHALGLRHVMLVGDCCDPFAPEVVRAAMGSIFNAHITLCAEFDFTAHFARWPGQIVGTALHNATDYRAVPYRKPMLLLMGSEQSGLSAPLVKICTDIAKLPMAANVDSLNLSVATGVMLYTVANLPSCSASST